MENTSKRNCIIFVYHLASTNSQANHSRSCYIFLQDSFHCCILSICLKMWAKSNFLITWLYVIFCRKWYKMANVEYISYHMNTNLIRLCQNNCSSICWIFYVSLAIVVLFSIFSVVYILRSICKLHFELTANSTFELFWET